MVPATSPRRPWFRLQFSLRAVLVMMLLVGIGLVIYRWPWERTQPYVMPLDGAVIPPDSGLFHGIVPPGMNFRGQTKFDGRFVTTYRRDWRGKPVAHGTQREYLANILIAEAERRDGVAQGRCRCFNGLGQVTEVAHYRAGQRHGSFRIGDGTTWTHVGEYFADHKDGAWRLLENRLTGPPMYWKVQTDPWGIYMSKSPQEWDPVPDHAIVVHQQWRRGLRHGHWEWRTRDGELLNTADYAADCLTHWNGQSVEPWYQALLRECASDPALVATLKEPTGHLAYNQMSLRTLERGFQDDWLASKPSGGGPPVDCSVVHFEMRWHNTSMVAQKQSIGLNLLETALLNGLTLQFRYGGLWLTPASEVSGPFQDPTGVDKVQFEPGSPQARAWDEPVELADGQVVIGMSSWLRYVLKETSIELSLHSQMNDKEPLTIDQCTFRTLRKRRDAFAHFLYRAGLRCEQQENTLVIKRHWTGCGSFHRFEGTNIPSFRTSPMPELQLLD